MLWLFSEVSGYKVNDQKSIIMDFDIPEQVKERLVGISDVRWASEGVKYLGIYTDRDLSMLAR